MLAPLVVSIHALREGRQPRRPASGRIRSFNHALREGDLCPQRAADSFIFSIHAPAEGRQRRGDQRAATCSFNHALREGRRQFWRDLDLLILVSIHAPARGATDRRFLNFASRCFNPRPCARGDLDRLTDNSCNYCFNPRPCARGDA